jgi:uncharacterized protein YdgA (DUF945 family)
VLGRLLTFDMQREEANERRRLGELQSKLDGMKIQSEQATQAQLIMQSQGQQSSFNKSAQGDQANTTRRRRINLYIK